MSGGSFDYKYSSLDIYEDNMLDEDLNKLVKDIHDILYELEWASSSDTSFERYRNKVNEFKTKWFGSKITENAGICKLCEQKVFWKENNNWFIVSGEEGLICNDCYDKKEKERLDKIKYWSKTWR